MKFKIDENLPINVAEVFRLAGYDALTVREQKLGGETDHLIAEVCQREKRVLITLDNDFADIRTYPPQEYSGLVVLRLKEQGMKHVMETIRRLMNIISNEPMDKSLWIVEEQKIRIRT